MGPQGPIAARQGNWKLIYNRVESAAATQPKPGPKSNSPADEPAPNAKNKPRANNVDANSGSKNNDDSPEAAEPIPAAQFTVQPELFNLAEDIGELSNVAAQHPEIVESLTEKIVTWESRLRNPRWRSAIQLPNPNKKPAKPKLKPPKIEGSKVPKGIKNGDK
jgi:hypothetical protein